MPGVYGAVSLLASENSNRLESLFSNTPRVDVAVASYDSAAYLHSSKLHNPTLAPGCVSHGALGHVHDGQPACLGFDPGLLHVLPTYSASNLDSINPAARELRSPCGTQVTFPGRSIDVPSPLPQSDRGSRQIQKFHLEFDHSRTHVSSADNKDRPSESLRAFAAGIRFLSAPSGSLEPASQQLAFNRASHQAVAARLPMSAAVGTMLSDDCGTNDPLVQPLVVHANRLATLDDLTALVQRWPQLEELKRSAHCSVSSSRFQHALSALVATSRCELDAALHSQRARRRGATLLDDLPLAVMVLNGASRHSDLQLLFEGGLQMLAHGWRLDASRLAAAMSRLHLAVGPPITFDMEPLPISFSEPDHMKAFRFPLHTLLFGPALAAGWPWLLALRLFSGFGSGFSHGRGHGFVHDRGKPAPLPGSLWQFSRLSSKSDPGAVVTLYFDCEAVVYVHCTRPVFQRMAQAEGRRTDPNGRRASRFLPDYIRMPTNADGTFVIPRFNVTSVVERRAEWARLIPNMDGVTRLIVNGKLCYPRNDWRILPSIRPNHASWNVADVKESLGKKGAVWLWQGAME